MRLRSAGVTNLGQWLNLHPLVSAAFGMVPVGLLHSAGDRDPAGDVRARGDLGLAHPSRLSDRDGGCRGRSPGTPSTAHRRRSPRASRSTRPARTRSSSRTRTQVPAVVDGHVRRAGRHPDDGAADRRAAAVRLHPVSRAAGPQAPRCSRPSPPLTAPVAALAAPAARADGDPASDYLLAAERLLPVPGALAGRERGARPCDGRRLRARRPCKVALIGNGRRPRRDPDPAGASRTTMPTSSASSSGSGISGPCSS